MGKRLEFAKTLYLRGIRDGKPREAIAACTGDRYTQHSTGVADGREGFIAFFEPFVQRNPVRDIQIVRGLEDDRFVFVHAYQNLGDGEFEWVTMDFFDTDDDGKIVEHWDVIVPFVAGHRPDRSSVDGPREVADRERTGENKDVVRRLIEVGFMQGDEGVIETCVATDYIEHRAEGVDGRAALIDRATGKSRSPTFDEVVLLVGEGNFVATLSRASEGTTDVCQADLFRLHDGIVVEHWDATEPVPAPGDTPNSGKF